MSVSGFGLLNSEGRALGTHWTGGLMGPTAVLHVVEKRKIPFHTLKSNQFSRSATPLPYLHTN